MPRAPFVACIAALLALTALAGCSDDSGPDATRTAAGDLDPNTMDLVRVRFCDLVPAEAIRTALGGDPADTQAWDNGDPVPGGSAADLGHEFGCAWNADLGRVARAWVFARPVAPSFARTLIKAASAQDRCTTSASEFGTPAALQVCHRPGKVLRVRQAGLFGQTWLTCEVSDPEARQAALVASTEQWCTAVANALDTSR
jgi:hypothetical protein